MRILHYSLGLPPYRTGGLTKFCLDLMFQQMNDGHSVFLAWPGEIRPFFKKTSFQLRNQFNYRNKFLVNYEIINPLPVSLDEGIRDILAYMYDGDENVYDDFLRKINPDVIHIHTFMGLHKSFLTAAKNIGIRVVFSTHDFFPICPKVTLFNDNSICRHANDCSKCAECNKTALSNFKIVLLQSRIYRAIKNTKIVKLLRSRHRNSFFSSTDSNVDYNYDPHLKNDYVILRRHYESMFQMADMIHYNSNLTKEVYDSFFVSNNNCVIPISHLDIKNHKKKKKYSNNVIRLRYLGPQNANKGFVMLKEALDELWKTNQRFHLDIHFRLTDCPEYITVNNRYDYDELEKIFDNTDCVIVPSVLYETFGYNVPESLSYGVPVIISDTVGSKDILHSGCGIVIDDINKDKIIETIKSLSVSTLQAMNENIIKEQKIINISDVAKQIEEKCYQN